MDGETAIGFFRAGTELLLVRRDGSNSYVVRSRDKTVPETTFDPEFGSAGTVYDGDADLEVHNPTFDRVPPTAPSAIITEEGVYAPRAIEPIANQHGSLREWDT